MQSTTFATTNPLPEPERTMWVDVTAGNLKERFICKYHAGQLIHGGDLGHVPTTKLLSELENEAIDQVAYVAEIRRRMQNGHMFTISAAERATIGEMVVAFGNFYQTMCKQSFTNNQLFHTLIKPVYDACQKLDQLTKRPQ